MSLYEDKKQLRTVFKSKPLSPDYIKSASMKIAERVINLPEFISAERVFIYMSTDFEPQTRTIIESAFKSGKTVLVPKCIGKHEMIAVKISSFDDLHTGAFGIPEPDSSDDLPTFNGSDIAIIPCVSADKCGARLGHGAGYYDRFLSKNIFVKICLCFEKRMSLQIPVDENDIKMDFVISEKDIYRI